MYLFSVVVYMCLFCICTFVSLTFIYFLMCFSLCVVHRMFPLRLPDYSVIRLKVNLYDSTCGDILQYLTFALVIQ